MTEKQGGTDVRANRSAAEKVSDGIYRLTGHKFFMSAPMSDAFIMLANTEEGMAASSCRACWKTALPMACASSG